VVTQHSLGSTHTQCVLWEGGGQQKRGDGGYQAAQGTASVPSPPLLPPLRGPVQYISELALGMYNKWTELRTVRAEQQWTSTALRLSLVRVDREEAAGVEEHHIRRAGHLLDSVSGG
jgi:hypothetical protein